MRKIVRCISLLPLTCIMSLLPFNSMDYGTATPRTDNYLISAHAPNTADMAYADEFAESYAAIQDATIPQTSSPTVASAQSVVPCTIGLINYYNQGDPRWADTLYGPKDPMKSHGCGPTAVAMIASSFTGQPVTPPDVALWASENGYCSPGEGSKHQLIPDGLTYYGLSVTSLSDRSVDSIISTIKSGKIIVALMNKGHFTNGGHFLLLTQVTEDGKIRIADPADWNNSAIAWEPQFILNEVRKKAEGGGPLWAVSMPPEI